MLESKRIYLRRFEEKDAEQLLKWGRNARYHNLAAFENYQNIEEAQRGVEQYMARPESFNKFKNICVIVFLKCYKVCYNIATRW